MKRIFIGILLALVGTLYCCTPKTMSPKSRVIQLTGNGGLCSGEQVTAPSGLTYILTAGHCRGLENSSGEITATTEDGRKLPRRVIAEDDASDLLLLEGIPAMTGLTIAASKDVNEHVRTFTHGGGKKTYMTEGYLIGDERVEAPIFQIQKPEDELKCRMAKHKIEDVDVFFGIMMKLCILSVDETAATAWVAPGSSGGMVINDSNELVGVVSASGGPFAFYVKLSDVQRFIANY